MKGFEAETEGQVIGVIAFGQFFAQSILAYHATYQDKIALINDFAKLINEIKSFGLICKLERSRFLSNIPFMKNYNVVSKPIELELLDGRDDFITIMSLVKNAKC